MANILQTIHRGDRSDIAFAHVQNIGRAYPFGWGVGEWFAGAVEGFHHKLRAEKALAAKRGNLNQGQRIAAQVARAAWHDGQLAYMAGDRIGALLEDAEIIVAAALFLIGKFADFFDLLRLQTGTAEGGQQSSLSHGLFERDNLHARADGFSNQAVAQINKGVAY